MARLLPTSREPLDDAARALEEMAAMLRAADPDNVQLLDSNRDRTYVDPDAEHPRVAADSCTVRVEWVHPRADVEPESPKLARGGRSGRSVFDTGDVEMYWHSRNQE